MAWSLSSHWWSPKRLRAEWDITQELRRQRSYHRTELENFGFKRSFEARYGGRIGILLTAILGGMVLFVSIKFFSTLLVFGLLQAVVPGAIALGALTFGLRQWRAVRNETALDGFYVRLEVTNCLLDEWDEVRRFAGPWPTIKGLTEEGSYRSRMYVYRELDGLEHAIAKYKIGFMSADNAHRSLRTIRQRCRESKEFCEIAWSCACTNIGYDDETREVVRLATEEADQHRLLRAVYKLVGERDGNTTGAAWTDAANKAEELDLTSDDSKGALKSLLRNGYLTEDTEIAGGGTLKITAKGIAEVKSSEEARRWVEPHTKE